MVILEALRAQFGDSLLLHWGTAAKPRLAVIDGGPDDVWEDALKPRLDGIRKARKLAAGEPLPIDLVMVSHIDGDHITGLIDMTSRMRDLKESKKPVPWAIRRFWHNSFDDLVGNDELGSTAAAGAAGIAAVGGVVVPGNAAKPDPEELGPAILATVGEGRELRKLLAFLKLSGNPPIGGLVRSGQTTTIAGLKLTVVAPLEKNLVALQKKWNKDIVPILKKEKKTKADLERIAQVASYDDISPANLSSIVALVEVEGKRLLLTGDARGDHTLKGLEELELVDDDGKIEVDVLKVPHHGSDRNVKTEYFERIVAKHYVISADGEHDNPDVATLEMISEARPDDDFTIHLTYPFDEFNVKKVGTAVEKFFAKERKAKRKYEVETRPSGELGLRLKLA